MHKGMALEKSSGMPDAHQRVGRLPKLWVQEAVRDDVCVYCSKKLTVKNTTKIKKVTESFRVTVSATV